MMSHNEAIAWRDIPRRERPLAVYAIVRGLYPDATTVAIQEEIEARHGKDVSIGWLYVTLERLEKDGFVRSETRRPKSDEEFALRGQRNERVWFVIGKKCEVGGYLRPGLAWQLS